MNLIRKRDQVDMAGHSHLTERILAPPFEWCFIPGGIVTLENAADDGGTIGGNFIVGDFAIAKYLITNAQYQRFVNHDNGYANTGWWGYSAEAQQWRSVRPKAHATAFSGDDVPRTRVSWFECMAFCAWLSNEIQGADDQPASQIGMNAVDTWLVRLPTEQQWQRAAVGDTAGLIRGARHLTTRTPTMATTSVSQRA